MRLVDAHVHLWDLEQHPLSWFREDMGLPSRATAADLAAVANADAAVAVQAADTPIEAHWLLAQAAASTAPMRVTLQYVPGSDSGRLPVAGLRAAVPQFAADLSDVPGLEALGTSLTAAGRVLEFLVRPQQLPGVAAFADRHPDLTIVVCHLGLGAEEPASPWRTGLAELGRRPHVRAKLSGMVGSRSDAQLQDIADAALDALGPGRLMFGSDWPMSARRHTHAEVIAATERMLSGLSHDERGAVWHGTADRTYALGAS